jgi:hypothetical protein
MSAQKRNKKPAKQQSASATPTQEQQTNPAAAQTPQAQANNNNSALGGASGGTGGGGGAQIAESQAYTPEVNPVLHLLYLADALQRENISPEVSNLVLSNLGDRIMGMMGQLNATSGLLQQLGSLRIDPSKAQTPSLEERLKQVGEVQKRVPPGMSISMEIPEGLNPYEVEQYNRAIELLMTNVAAQLAAGRSMLGQQLSRLLSYARQADALINSPGYVRPEEVPGSIVHGRNPLDVQLIDYGGIPEQDDSGEWTMRPGLGIQALFYQVPPRLDLPPLQLPKEFPKPPKPSEFRLNLSKKEPSGSSSKPQRIWNVFDVASASTKTFNPASEEKQRLLDTFNNITRQVAGLGPEVFRDEWKRVVASISTALNDAPAVQAEQLAGVGGEAGVKLAEDILSAVMEQMPVYSNWQEAEAAAQQGKIRHGAVFYINSSRQWFFAEENRGRSGGREVKFHSFERIADPMWIKETSHNTYHALAEAWRNLSAIIGAAVRNNPDLVQRYAQIMGLPSGQANSTLLLIPHLAIGLLNDTGRNALSSRLYGGNADKLWNNVIHQVASKKLGKSARQQGASGQHPWDIK